MNCATRPVCCSAGDTLLTGVCYIKSHEGEEWRLVLYSCFNPRVYFLRLTCFLALERLVDGSVAAHAMRQTAHTMHPSQAVMSCFKEPQKAVP